MSDLLVLPVKNIRVIADLNTRAMAYLADLIVFYFLILVPFSMIYEDIAGVPLESLDINDIESNMELMKLFAIEYFSCGFIFMFYFISFEYLIGGSIGKKIFHLSVISKKGKLEMKQLFLRSALKSVLVNFLFIDCFLMIFDKEKRRLSDFLSNTIVVSDRKIIKKFPVVNGL